MDVKKIINKILGRHIDTTSKNYEVNYKTYNPVGRSELGTQTPGYNRFGIVYVDPKKKKK